MIYYYFSKGYWINKALETEEIVWENQILEGLTICEIVQKIDNDVSYNYNPNKQLI